MDGYPRLLMNICIHLSAIQMVNTVLASMISPWALTGHRHKDEIMKTRTLHCCTILVFSWLLVRYVPAQAKSLSTVFLTPLNAQRSPTAAQHYQENTALDAALLDLLSRTKNYGGFHKGHKVLFHSQAWPTYHTHQSLIVLGDLNAVGERMQKKHPTSDPLEQFPWMWDEALGQIYPDCSATVSSCHLTHKSATKISIVFDFGPSAHGATALYTLLWQRNHWKIIQHDLYWKE